MPNGRFGTSKYAALTSALLALPPEQGELRYTFAELEAVIGEPLPAGAWNATFWTSSTTARSNWRGHGWQAQLDRSTRSVVFTREQA